MNTDLETMIPQPDEVILGGKTIVLKPVTMGTLQPAIQATLPIIRALKSGALDIEKLKSLDPLICLEAYAEYGAALSEMMAYLTGVSIDELNKCDPFEVIDAAITVTRVNMDFFVSWARLIPGAPDRPLPNPPPQAGEGALKEVGPSNSSDSSELDTDTRP